MAIKYNDKSVKHLKFTHDVIQDDGLSKKVTEDVHYVKFNKNGFVWAKSYDFNIKIGEGISKIVVKLIDQKEPITSREATQPNQDFQKVLEGYYGDKYDISLIPLPGYDQKIESFSIPESGNLWSLSLNRRKLILNLIKGNNVKSFTSNPINGSEVETSQAIQATSTANPKYYFADSNANDIIQNFTVPDNAVTKWDYQLASAVIKRVYIRYAGNNIECEFNPPFDGDGMVDLTHQKVDVHVTAKLGYYFENVKFQNGEYAYSDVINIPDDINTPVNNGDIVYFTPKTAQIRNLIINYDSYEDNSVHDSEAWFFDNLTVKASKPIAGTFSLHNGESIPVINTTDGVVYYKISPLYWSQAVENLYTPIKIDSFSSFPKNRENNALFGYSIKNNLNDFNNPIFPSIQHRQIRLNYTTDYGTISPDINGIYNFKDFFPSNSLDDSNKKDIEVHAIAKDTYHFFDKETFIPDSEGSLDGNYSARYSKPFILNNMGYHFEPIEDSHHFKTLVKTIYIKYDQYDNTKIQPQTIFTDAVPVDKNITIDYKVIDPCYYTYNNPNWITENGNQICLTRREYVLPKRRENNSNYFAKVPDIRLKEYLINFLNFNDNLLIYNAYYINKQNNKFIPAIFDENGKQPSDSSPFFPNNEYNRVSYFIKTKNLRQYIWPDKAFKEFFTESIDLRKIQASEILEITPQEDLTVKNKKFSIQMNADSNTTLTWGTGTHLNQNKEYDLMNKINGEYEVKDVDSIKPKFTTKHPYHFNFDSTEKWDNINKNYYIELAYPISIDYNQQDFGNKIINGQYTYTFSPITLLKQIAVIFNNCDKANKDKVMTKLMIENNTLLSPGETKIVDVQGEVSILQRILPQFEKDWILTNGEKESSTNKGELPIRQHCKGTITNENSVIYDCSPWYDPKRISGNIYQTSTDLLKLSLINPMDDNIGNPNVNEILTNNQKSSLVKNGATGSLEFILDKNKYKCFNQDFPDYPNSSDNLIGQDFIYTNKLSFNNQFPIRFNNDGDIKEYLPSITIKNKKIRFDGYIGNNNVIIDDTEIHHNWPDLTTPWAWVPLPVSYTGIIRSVAGRHFKDGSTKQIITVEKTLADTQKIIKFNIIAPDTFINQVQVHWNQDARPLYTTNIENNSWYDAGSKINLIVTANYNYCWRGNSQDWEWDDSSSTGQYTNRYNATIPSIAPHNSQFIIDIPPLVEKELNFSTTYTEDNVDKCIQSKPNGVYGFTNFLTNQPDSSYTFSATFIAPQDKYYDSLQWKEGRYQSTSTRTITHKDIDGLKINFTAPTAKTKTVNLFLGNLNNMSIIHPFYTNPVNVNTTLPIESYAKRGYYYSPDVTVKYDTYNGYVNMSHYTSTFTIPNNLQHNANYQVDFPIAHIKRVQAQAVADQGTTIKDQSFTQNTLIEVLEDGKEKRITATFEAPEGYYFKDGIYNSANGKYSELISENLPLDKQDSEIFQIKPKAILQKYINIDVKSHANASVVERIPEYTPINIPAKGLDISVKYKANEGYYFKDFSATQDGYYFKQFNTYVPTTVEYGITYSYNSPEPFIKEVKLTINPTNPGVVYSASATASESTIIEQDLPKLFPVLNANNNKYTFNIHERLKDKDHWIFFGDQYGKNNQDRYTNIEANTNLLHQAIQEVSPTPARRKQYPLSVELHPGEQITIDSDLMKMPTDDGFTNPVGLYVTINNDPVGENMEKVIKTLPIMQNTTRIYGKSSANFTVVYKAPDGYYYAAPNFGVYPTGKSIDVNISSTANDQTVYTIKTNNNWPYREKKLTFVDYGLKANTEWIKNNFSLDSKYQVSFFKSPFEVEYRAVKGYYLGQLNNPQGIFKNGYYYDTIRDSVALTDNPRNLYFNGLDAYMKYIIPDIKPGANSTIVYCEENQHNIPIDTIVETIYAANTGYVFDNEDQDANYQNHYTQVTYNYHLPWDKKHSMTNAPVYAEYIGPSARIKRVKVEITNKPYTTIQSRVPTTDGWYNVPISLEANYLANEGFYFTEGKFNNGKYSIVKKQLVDKNVIDSSTIILNSPDPLVKKVRLAPNPKISGVNYEAIISDNEIITLPNYLFALNNSKNKYAINFHESLKDKQHWIFYGDEYGKNTYDRYRNINIDTLLEHEGIQNISVTAARRKQYLIGTSLSYNETATIRINNANVMDDGEGSISTTETLQNTTGAEKPVYGTKYAKSGNPGSTVNIDFVAPNGYYYYNAQDTTYPTSHTMTKIINSTATDYSKLLINNDWLLREKEALFLKYTAGSNTTLLSCSWSTELPVPNTLISFSKHPYSITYQANLGYYLPSVAEPNSNGYYQKTLSHDISLTDPHKTSFSFTSENAAVKHLIIKLINLAHTTSQSDENNKSISVFNKVYANVKSNPCYVLTFSDGYGDSQQSHEVQVSMALPKNQKHNNTWNFYPEKGIVISYKDLNGTIINANFSYLEVIRKQFQYQISNTKYSTIYSKDPDLINDKYYYFDEFLNSSNGYKKDFKVTYKANSGIYYPNGYQSANNYFMTVIKTLDDTKYYNKPYFVFQEPNPSIRKVNLIQQGSSGISVTVSGYNESGNWIENKILPQKVNVLNNSYANYNLDITEKITDNNWIFYQSIPGKPDQVLPNKELSYNFNTNLIWNLLNNSNYSWIPTARRKQYPLNVELHPGEKITIDAINMPIDDGFTNPTGPYSTINSNTVGKGQTNTIDNLSIIKNNVHIYGKSSGSFTVKYQAPAGYYYAAPNFDTYPTGKNIDINLSLTANDQTIYTIKTNNSWPYKEKKLTYVGYGLKANTERTGDNFSSLLDGNNQISFFDCNQQYWVDYRAKLGYGLGSRTNPQGTFKNGYYYDRTSDSISLTDNPRNLYFNGKSAFIKDIYLSDNSNQYFPDPADSNQFNKYYPVITSANLDLLTKPGYKFTFLDDNGFDTYDGLEVEGTYKLPKNLQHRATHNFKLYDFHVNRYKDKNGTWYNINGSNVDIEGLDIRLIINDNNNYKCISSSKESGQYYTLPWDVTTTYRCLDQRYYISGWTFDHSSGCYQNTETHVCPMTTTDVFTINPPDPIREIKQLWIDIQPAPNSTCIYSDDEGQPINVTNSPLEAIFRVKDGYLFKETNSAEDYTVFYPLPNDLKHSEKLVINGPDVEPITPKAPSISIPAYSTEDLIIVNTNEYYDAEVNLELVGYATDPDDSTYSETVGRNSINITMTPNETYMILINEILDGNPYPGWKGDIQITGTITVKGETFIYDETYNITWDSSIA